MVLAPEVLNLVPAQKKIIDRLNQSEAGYLNRRILRRRTSLSRLLQSKYFALGFKKLLYFNYRRWFIEELNKMVDYYLLTTYLLFILFQAKPGGVT